MKRSLAIDLGASTGRAVLGAVEDGKLSLCEVRRFDNVPVTKDGALRWDLQALRAEIELSLQKARDMGGFDSVGIDAWGVDFGLLDAQGALLEDPLHYRDKSSVGAPERFFKRLCRDELYAATGLQMMHINSLFQLEACRTERPAVFERATRLLMMPCLFAYLLTGEAKNEYTALSTSQLLCAADKSPYLPALSALGAPPTLTGEMALPGEILGMLSDDLCEKLSIEPVPVIAVGMHDTASAVAAVPTKERDFIYISSGTWSLFGTELCAPLITEKTLRYNLANEGGVDGTVRLLRNIMGLWLIQESRRQFRREGDAGVSFADLEREARAAEPFMSFIDPNDPAFEAPGNVPARIGDYCRRTGQPQPQNRGALVRCIYESLAFCYRRTLSMIEDATEKRYPVIHIVGGGVKDDFLSQFTANACGIPVVAGPVEATAIGNLCVQLRTLGALDDVRAAVRASFAQKRFSPRETALWNAQYARFLAVTGA